MAISLNQFIDENLGERLDIPGGSDDQELLGQCVSLVQQYLYQCLDIPFAARGHAKEWVNLPSNIAVQVDGDPQRGDIIIYPNRGVGSDGTIYGHIGVVVSPTQTFEQNVAPLLYAQYRNISDAVNSRDEYVLMRPVGTLVDDEILNGIYLYAETTPFRVRTEPVTGSQIDLVLVGRQAEILNFVPGFQSDGFQWARVKYNGQIGYSQLDLKNDYKIVKGTSASTTYLKAGTSGFYVRTAIVTGSVITTVTSGNEAQILSFETDHASDGYQWAKVNYNGAIGYAQIDTEEWNRLTQYN